MLGKLIDKLSVTFFFKTRDKKTVNQKNSDMQIYQEKGITNYYSVGNITVNQIQKMADSTTLDDPQQLLNIAGQRFLIEQSIRQANLKNIVDQAKLQTIPNPQEPEKDWFLKWFDISQTVSRSDVQGILARILAGEVKHPSTFSLRTLDTLKNLEKNDLEIFQRICNISFSIPIYGDEFTSIIVAPFEGNPGNNSLKDIDLSYLHLTHLQDAGLIQNELGSWFELLIPQTFQLPFTIGAKHYLCKALDEVEESKPHVNTIFFTKVGKELRKVMTLGSNDIYENRIRSWLQERKLELVPINQD